MDRRAADLIDRLDLRPHPEGGYYRECYRSTLQVVPCDGRAGRRALTTIYFLLIAGHVSCWHRVWSDEAWHYHEGDPLELHVAEAGFHELRSTTLGRVADGQEAMAVVPAGMWQAARTTGAYTLVGCTVGPGFDFTDFTLLTADDSALAVATRSRHASRVREFLTP